MLDRPIGGFGPHWPGFMHFAAEARDAAIQVETADAKAWPMRDALSAILFSALAAGAFINEFPEAASRDAYGIRDLQLPAASVLDDLALTLNAMEQAREGIQPKYDAARKILTGRAFDHGVAPFQDFNDLMKLRNDLVHPRHLDQTTGLGHTEPASPVVRDLQQRGLTRTRGRRRGDPMGGMSWLSEIYCGRMAAWAHKAACDVIVDLIRALPRHERLWFMTSFRNWLASPARSGAESGHEVTGLEHLTPCQV
jgi:hypothetical protein